MRLYRPVDGHPAGRPWSAGGGHEVAGRPSGARASVCPSLPARVVPVAPEIRCFAGNHHEVAQADGDVLVAAGTEIALGRFVGLHPSDLDVLVQRVAGRHHPRKAHMSRPRHTTSAATTMT
jgi:hypothetical protein